MLAADMTLELLLC